MADAATRDRILDAAEARARAGGYLGFSFRDVASDVGIKSASVHYHFPTKAKLGEALVGRYTERALQSLGSHEGVAPAEAIARVTSLFRAALVTDDRMCLCGVFGAERDVLPAEVAAGTADFFRAILGYLSAAFGTNWRGSSPEAVLARLEGALILARTLDDPALFERAAQTETSGA